MPLTKTQRVEEFYCSSNCATALRSLSTSTVEEKHYSYYTADAPFRIVFIILLMENHTLICTYHQSI